MAVVLEETWPKGYVIVSETHLSIKKEKKKKKKKSRKRKEERQYKLPLYRLHAPEILFTPTDCQL